MVDVCCWLIPSNILTSQSQVRFAIDGWWNLLNHLWSLDVSLIVTKVWRNGGSYGTNRSNSTYNPTLILLSNRLLGRLVSLIVVRNSIVWRLWFRFWLGVADRSFKLSLSLTHGRCLANILLWSNARQEGWVFDFLWLLACSFPASWASWDR